jgi:hypothetical protein
MEAVRPRTLDSTVSGIDLAEAGNGDRAGEGAMSWRRERVVCAECRGDAQCGQAAPTFAAVELEYAGQGVESRVTLRKGVRAGTFSC